MAYGVSGDGRSSPLDAPADLRATLDELQQRWGSIDTNEWPSGLNDCRWPLGHPPLVSRPSRLASDGTERCHEGMGRQHGVR
jgi:hypothetical protein